MGILVVDGVWMGRRWVAGGRFVCYRPAGTSGKAKKERRIGSRSDRDSLMNNTRTIDWLSFP